MVTMTTVITMNWHLRSTRCHVSLPQVTLVTALRSEGTVPVPRRGEWASTGAALLLFVLQLQIGNSVMTPYPTPNSLYFYNSSPWLGMGTVSCYYFSCIKSPFLNALINTSMLASNKILFYQRRGGREKQIIFYLYLRKKPCFKSMR